jgi:excisionase family DNA binding protein
MLLTTPQAAARLGLTVRAVQKMIEAGRLTAQKVGRDYLIDPLALENIPKQAPGRPPKQVTATSKKKGNNEMINQHNIIIGDRVRMRYGNHAGEIATVTNITWHSTQHGGLYARFNISFEGGEVDERGLDSLEKVKESDNDSALTASAGH